MIGYILLIAAGLSAVGSSPPGTNLNPYQSLAFQLSYGQPAQPSTLNGLDLHASNVFDQLLDVPKLDKLCKGYIKEKQPNHGINNLLQVVCKKRNQVLRENSDCLSGMVDRLREACEHVCVQQIQQGPNMESPECFLAICVGGCIDRQMNECFAESGGQQRHPQALIALYSEVMSTVVSTSLNTNTESEFGDRIKKLPRACAEFLEIPVRALRSPAPDQHNLENPF